MKRDIHSSIRRSLSKKACYILITCDEPKADGKMEVEMTYEGDVALAAYLLEGAVSAIDDEVEMENGQSQAKCRLS